MEVIVIPNVVWCIWNDRDTNYSWCTGNSTHVHGKETGGSEYQRMNRDLLDHGTVKIS